MEDISTVQEHTARLGGFTYFWCLVLQSTLAVWVKWPQHPSAPYLNGKLRQHGSVCHQDPRYRKDTAVHAQHT